MTSKKLSPREFMIADPDRYQCMDCGSLICSEDPGEINKYYEGVNLRVIEYLAYEAAQNEAEKYKKLCERLRKALAYYGGIDYDSDAYLDIFDCIKRTSESTTDFDDLKFSKIAREALFTYDAAINPDPNLNTHPENTEESW